MGNYIALLRKDEDSDYGVEFPDFPGCVTAGTSLEDARRMAAQALALHVDGMLEDGERVPEPSDLDVIASSRGAKGAVPFLVSVADPRKRAVRVNVTFDEDILEEIDSYAEEHGLSRSGLLSRAVIGVIRDTVSTRSRTGTRLESTGAVKAKRSVKKRSTKKSTRRKRSA